MPKPASATEFGMDYYPYIDGVLTNQFLYSDKWNLTTTQNTIKADLNMMNSMGLTCQRMLFFPHGWITTKAYNDPNPDPPHFDAHWGDMLQNLPAYLALLDERDIRLVIASPSPLLKHKSKRQGYTNLWLWQYFYGPNEWDAFMDHTQKYLTELVNAVATSGHPTTVKWFDISNEISTNPQPPSEPILNYSQYLQEIYDSGWIIPASKIGFSVLRVVDGGQNDFHDLRNTNNNGPWLGVYRAQDTMLTDTHCYPERNAQAISKLGYRYTQGRTYFPNSTGIVGEYGYSYDYPSSEATQKDKEKAVMDACIAAGVPYAMHWMWSGRYLPPPPEDDDDEDHVVAYWFRNHDINKPNDIVGYVGTRLSLFTNGDMESGTSALPTGWSYASNGVVQPTPARVGGQGVGATGDYYYRLTSSRVGDTIWTVSPRVEIPLSSSKIYVNAYIRSTSMSNVRIAVHQYDGSGQEISQAFSTSPALPPGTWPQWYSFQHRIDPVEGGWICSANALARYVRVNVQGRVDAGTAILDTDTVTLSVR